MNTDNYFRSGRSVFFFDSSDRDTILRAWESAMRVPDHPVAIWHPVVAFGPWTGGSIIGCAPLGPRPLDPLDYDKWNAARAMHERMWTMQTNHVI